MTSLLANFFKRNVTLNMGATDERRPQTACPPPGKSVRSFYNTITGIGGRTYDKMYVDESAYLKEQILKAYGLSAKDIYGDKETLSKGVWNMPYDKPAYFGPYKAQPVVCPYCKEAFYENEIGCEHWTGKGWTKDPKKEDARFGYQFKEEFDKKFPDDIYPDGYRSDTKVSDNSGPTLLKDALRNSRRGRVISGYGRIDSGFDWE